MRTSSHCSGELPRFESSRAGIEVHGQISHLSPDMASSLERTSYVVSLSSFYAARNPRIKLDVPFLRRPDFRAKDVGMSKTERTAGQSDRGRDRSPPFSARKKSLAH